MGPVPYKVVKTRAFESSFDVVCNSYGKAPSSEFAACIADIVEQLTLAPLGVGSSPEPAPKKVRQQLTDSKLVLRKVRFNLEDRTGAASKARLIYLVHRPATYLVLLSVYTHAQFAGRPPDKSLANAIRDAADELNERIALIN